MKVTVVIGMLLALLTICGSVLSKDQTPYIGMNFAASATIMDTVNNMDYDAQIYSSAKTQKMRIYYFLPDDESAFISIFYRYDLGSVYLYDMENDICRMLPLIGKMNSSICLPDDSHLVQQITFGETKAKVWTFHNTAGVLGRYIGSANQNIPIQYYVKELTTGATSVDIFDYEVGIQDESEFELPAACSNLSQKKRLLERPIPTGTKNVVKPGFDSRMTKIAEITKVLNKIVNLRR